MRIRRINENQRSQDKSYLTMDKKPDSRIKVPKGTIVKQYGHPIKLKTALYIKNPDGKFFEDHQLMDWVFDSEDSE